MQVKLIEVTIDYRINLGDFEGISNPIKMIAELEDGDTPEAATEELYKMAWKAWAKEIIRRIHFTRSRREDKSSFDAFIENTLKELKRAFKE